MPSNRLPVYLLIDTSGSMSGAPIAAVNQGISRLIDSLRNDATAAQSVWLSVITYDKDVKVLLPLTALSDVAPLHIQCPQSGPTHLGEGLQVLNECVGREVNSSADQSPLLFIMTDGKPSDVQLFNEQYLVIQQRGFAKIVGCAAGPKAKADELRKFCEPVLSIDNIDAAALAQFFQLVSESVATDSASPASAPEPVAPPPPVQPEPALPEPTTPESEPVTASSSSQAGTVNVVITGCGISTFEARKLLQEFRPDLGSFDIFELIRDFPKTVIENVPEAKGEEAKKRLEEAGCTVELTT